MNAAAALWKYLLTRAQPRPAPQSLAAEPAPSYALWLERPDVGRGRHRSTR